MSSFEDATGVNEGGSEEIATGGIANVTFRVRCETLGHGEAVYLFPEGDTSAFRGVPLFTTAKRYPWYSIRSPIALTLPPRNKKTQKKPDIHYKYRYAIFRSGVFHRWEDPSDGPVEECFHSSIASLSYDGEQGDTGEEESISYHEVRLRLLAADEGYIVSDVLGLTDVPPEMEKIRARPSCLLTKPSSLHSRGSMHSSVNSLKPMQGNSKGSGVSLSKEERGEKSSRKKKVGFAPSPAPYHKTASRAMQRNVNLSSTDGLVVASAFLPVHLHRSDDGKWSADWDYEMLLSMQTHLRVTRVGYVKWRGWHGNVMHGHHHAHGSPECGVPVEERDEVERCLRPFNCVPVWCDPPKFGEMYNGFCKGVLWPIFHNVTSVYSSQTEGNGSSAEPLNISGHAKEMKPETDDQFLDYTTDDVAFPIHGDGGQEAALWSAYTEINRQFADTIIQCFNEGDLVWIHGFHLLILPSLLTRRVPMAKIGIFLHTPFPSSEIFRTLWCREDLLRGMLNADQVGFHLFEYARHFLTCCRRLLGLNYGMIPDGYGGHNLAIEVSGRHVTVTSIHAGVESNVGRNILNLRSVQQQAVSIQQQFEGKVIFVGIDRMESLKGIPLKMLGLERFLLRCPEWVGKVVLVQVGISAFERGDDYFKTKNEVLAITKDINRCWPGSVQFQECAESEMRLQQRLALMRAADVVLVTSLRDGLNLLPLEFTVAHQDALTEQGRADGRQRGLCILSEFSSCTRVMRGALHVNPWKISEIANAFHQAVSMSQDERMRRISCASEFVSRVTTQRWALAVMLDLKAVHKNLDAGRYSGAGLGLGFRLLGMDTGFNSLDANAVAKAYKNSKSRLILLDYGGTILRNDNADNLHRYQMVNKLRAPSPPTKRLITLLEDLCEDPRNTVFVVSGKERHSIAKALGHIPGLGLAAEHGMFISWPTSRKHHRRLWDTIVPDQDSSWRSIAITIMEVYTSRTHGSYIEETEMKVLWQYRDADPEFGYLQARELEDHLANVLRAFSVDVLHGGMEEGGYVEVRPKGVNKGVVAMHIIKNYPKFNSHRVDFTLAIGDDHCDEPMLSVMRSIARRVAEAQVAKTSADPPLPPLPATVTLVDVSSCDQYISTDMEIFTCTVGKKPSAAKNYLNDVDDVHELLDCLNKVAARDKKSSSMSDLRSLNAKDIPMDDDILIKQASQLLTQAQYTDTICAGVTRRMVMGSPKSLHEPEEQASEVSKNLIEFIGNFEGEDDEDDMFF